MGDVDILVTQKFVELREKALEVIRGQHPYLINIIEAAFGSKENRVGLQVTEQGQVIGEYTFYTKGIRVERAEAGKLDSLFKHPLLDLTVRPYAIMEKKTIEEIVSDNRMTQEPFQTLMKYLPDITIKFMR